MNNSINALGAILEQSGESRPYRDSTPIKVDTVTLLPPGEGEILVKIRAAGLCHSDLSVVNNDRPRPLPMLLGHESAGIVECVGPGVTKVEPGDHVVMTFLPRCEECAACKTNGKIPCEYGSAANGAGTLLRGAERIYRGTEKIHHHLGVSGFATHAVIAEESVVKIGKDIPFDIAAVFGCAVLTGGGAVMNEINPSADSSLAVVGLGGVGVAAILTAKALGVAHIIAVDMHPEKCQLATQVGADVAYTPAEVETLGIKADNVVEAAGSPRALELAFNMTNPGGMTVTVGLPAPGSTITLNPLTFTAEARKLHGSYLGSAVPSRDIPRFEQLWRDGKLDAHHLISSYIQLEEINEALDALADGTVIRQIIRFDE